MKRVFLIVFTFTLPVLAQFTGSISGAINAGNNNWGPGQVTLTGDVTIPAGQTLTVNPGTRINGLAGINADGGTLHIEGTFEEPVDIWDTWIAILGGSGHSIAWTIMFSQGNTAIEVNNARINFSHFQMQSFGGHYSNTPYRPDWGIRVHGAQSRVDIDFCTIGSRTRLFTGDDVSLEGIAVFIEADAAGSGHSITNSVLGFLDNASNTGLVIAAPSTTIRVAYTFVSGPGSRVNTSDTASVYRGMPRVKDIPNLDYHLDWFSPAIDAADPAEAFSNEPAPNGGRANLGYFGNTPEARITSVEIRTPNGCEQLNPGNPYTITWGSVRHAGSKHLQYSTDGGANWTDVTTITDDQGRYAWTVPVVTSADCKVRMVSTADPAIADESDRVFGIGAAPNPNQCEIAERCPAGTDGCKFFHTICYAGYRNGQSPGSGQEPSYAQVEEDLNMLAPLTHGIRTYGTGTGHGATAVPFICDELGLDLHMGIWVDDTYGDGSNRDQIAMDMGIVDDHPSIKTVIVGNEYLLRVRQAHGDVEGAEARLVGLIEYAKSLAPPGIRIVTGESWPDWMAASKALFDAVDMVVWHVHPWWEQKPVSEAADHVEFAHTEVLRKMAEVGVSKPMVLGETGYPWGATTGAAVGSEANQAQYLRDLHDYSIRSGLVYWFFSAFDEQWKAGAEGSVGDKWGMYKADRTPHPIAEQFSSLIDPGEMWPSGSYVMTINFGNFTSNSLLNNQDYDEIRVLDLNGRLMNCFPADSYRSWETSCPPESGIFILKFINKGSNAGFQRVLKR